MRDRLYRLRRDRVIGGLASGMGRSLGVDPTWVRIGWVVLGFATQGIAVLVYIALLFVVPEIPEGMEEAPGIDGPRTVGGESAGAASAEPSTIAGGSTSSRTRPDEGFSLNFDTEGSRSAALIVGLVLVAAGAWLLLRRFVPFDFDLGWPVVAVIAGVVLIAVSLRTGRSG